MLKGFSMRFVRDRRMIRFGRRWNTTHVASAVPAAHHHADENGMTALHWEAKKGCSDAVKSLIDAGADIEARNSLGRSPLFVACENGNFAQVKMLVEAGASVCATDQWKRTCLTLAAQHGHAETVRYLVGLKDADINSEDNNYKTALRSALRGGHSDAVQVLIDAGADIEAKDQMGRSPLLVASCEGKRTIVKMLVEAGAEVCVTDDRRESCLFLAAFYGHTETVCYLVGLKEVDVDFAAYGGFTSLHGAVDRHSPDTVQVLIDAGADIEAKDCWGNSPVETATYLGHGECVELLVEAGAERVLQTTRLGRFPRYLV